MFYLIEKLATAVRGGTREVLETAVDANATRILGQEIYEAESHLREAKQHLAQVMADKLRLQRQLEAQKIQLATKEALIRRHLEQSDEAAALSLAEDFSQYETRLEQQQRQHAQLHAYEQRLLQTLKSTANKLEHYRAELRMAQATQHAQQAVGKLSRHANVHSDKFARMQDSLERIRQRHDTFDDQMQAQQDIDAYLNGDLPPTQHAHEQAAAVLARLRNTSQP
ncbi:MAG: hypothetical protein BWK73_07985 [Thiothrix lacustris]|uniref:Phage shock protein A n=1 Tax=Thiothrix lacustris TaxID=525917 RepID=A0A1Y1QWM9_9GAMM|nr:MAG: hypothetical protein BWK73_07985 [Thiothrix lacustris]